MHLIKQLFELQETDTAISSLEKSLSKVRARLADDSEVVAATKRVADIEARLPQATAAHRGEDHAQQALADKSRAVEERLYGGTVSNTRELSGLEMERVSLQKQRNEQDERLLEAMLQLDDVRESLKSAKTALEQLEAARTSEREVLLKEEATLSSDLEKLAARRSAAVQPIPPQSLALYESLLKSKAGLAVVRVERGQCQGCRVSLPINDLQRAKNGSTAVQCNSCRRIVYPVQHGRCGP